MDLNIFKIIGILGILLISIGIMKRKRKIEDIYYILGGIFILTYSIHIKDIIFIILQIIFILTALYDEIRLKKKFK